MLQRYDTDNGYTLQKIACPIFTASDPLKVLCADSAGLLRGLATGWGRGHFIFSVSGSCPT